MTTSMRLAAVSCLVFALAVPAVAQSLRVDIPFDFQVADRGLPAGHYVVSVDVPSRRVVLNDYDRRYINTVFLTGLVIPQGLNQTALVFHKYGEQYFLREVRTPASSVTMPISQSERFVKRAALENRGPKMAMVQVANH